MVNSIQTIGVKVQDLAPLEIAIGQVPMSNGLIVEGLIQRLGCVTQRMMPDDLEYVNVKVLNEENALMPNAAVIPYRANAMVRRISLCKGG